MFKFNLLSLFAGIESKETDLRIFIAPLRGEETCMETDTQMDIVTFRLKNNAPMPSLHFKMHNTYFAMINVKGSQSLTLFYYTLNPG